MNSEALSTILNYGVMAPSADNLQPWIVRNNGHSLEILVNESKAIPSVGNMKNTASLVSLGAMIENINIASLELGYAMSVELFPQGEANAPVASISFEPRDKSPQKLLPFLSSRCTNRRPYLAKPLEEMAKKALLESALDSGGQLDFVEEKAQKHIVAKAVCANDRILFEQQDLHHYLFSAFRWSDKEAQDTRDGLDIKTFELGPAAMGFRMLKSWAFTRLINAVGLGRFLPSLSYRLCQNSSALALLQMKGVTFRSFLDGGRALQRVWLTAASYGLSIQPMTGIAYFVQRLYQEEAKGLSERHKRLIAESEKLLKQVFPLERNNSMILLFRIGYAPPPSARSLRRSLV